MTPERRQDLILVAVTVSLAAHIALMVAMRPQIMTSVQSRFQAHRDRAPMVVRDAVPPPESVRIEALRDVDAAKAAPAAESDEVVPVAPAFSAPGAEAADAAPAPSAEVAPTVDPKVEVAPFMSEKIHVDAPSSFTTPIARSEPRAVAVSAPAPAGPSPKVSPDVEIPMFTAPAYVPEAKGSVESVSLPAKEAEGEAFEPAREVMPEVDEKVVESEKAAVRRMLDVRDAAELDKFVNVVATSANQGDWTYFRVQVTPRASLRTVPKDFVVILDASGSIGNDRLQSCRAAARRILRSAANTGDRFNLVAFRDRFTYAFRSWQECTQGAFSRADRWLTSLAAHGRTDVFATISSVLALPRDPKRPLVALVVTDGDANEGVSGTDEILSRFTELNDGLVSVYMYGVKKSANRELIDVLTHGNRGESFIFEGSRWSAGSGIEGLSERFRDPVLSDLRIVFSSATRAEAYPRLLRNLYRGEVVDLVGRVPRGTADVSFSLKGLSADRPYEGFFRLHLAEAAFDAGLPEAWSREQALDARLRR